MGSDDVPMEFVHKLEVECFLAIRDLIEGRSGRFSVYSPSDTKGKGPGKAGASKTRARSEAERLEVRAGRVAGIIRFKAGFCS